ncbi:MAG: hypothetical protein GC161_15230 [Planctomycetaceae bacterium]|nr:hypothetical protein [Planctomycetaceae bacterium]
MKSTRIDTLHYWGQYQPDRRIDFNGFFWTRPQGGVLIDPMPLDDAQIAFVREHGGAAHILVTNADHWRASSNLAETLGATIVAPRRESKRLADRADLVGEWFDGSGDLPAALRGHLAVHWIEGGKSPAEPVLDLLAEDALYFSDVVRSHRSGALMLLPAAKLENPTRVAADLAKLAGRRPGAVLLGDGDSLFAGAAELFERFVAEPNQP